MVLKSFILGTMIRGILYFFCYYQIWNHFFEGSWFFLHSYTQSFPPSFNEDNSNYLPSDLSSEVSKSICRWSRRLGCKRFLPSICRSLVRRNVRCLCTKTLQFRSVLLLSSCPDRMFLWGQFRTLLMKKEDAIILSRFLNNFWLVFHLNISYKQ